MYAKTKQKLITFTHFSTKQGVARTRMVSRVVDM